MMMPPTQPMPPQAPAMDMGGNDKQAALIAALQQLIDILSGAPDDIPVTSEAEPPMEASPEVAMETEGEMPEVGEEEEEVEKKKK